MKSRIAAGGLLAASALVLAGCVAEVPAPVTSPPAMQDSAALLSDQSDRIVKATMAELAAADEAKDPKLLSDRVGGHAVTVRAAQYKEAAADEKSPPVTLPADQQQVYASASQTWPRTLATVSEPASPEVTPVVYLWVQDSVADDYQLRSWAHMVPGATLPVMASTATGSEQLALDDPAFDPTLQTVLNNYLELLRGGSGVEQAKLFADDAYRSELFAARSSFTKAAKEQDGTYVDTIDLVPNATYAMGTADGGALIFAPITIASTFTVEDATVLIPKAEEALLEGTVDDTVTHHYLDMIVLSVPAPDSTDLPAVVAGEHNLIKVAKS